MGLLLDALDDLPGDEGECDGACQAASPQPARGGEGVAHGGRPRHDQVAVASGGKLPKNIFPIFFPIFPGAVSCWRCLRLGPRPALSRYVDNKTPCVLTFFTWFFNLMVLLGARLGACSTKGRW